MGRKSRSEGESSETEPRRRSSRIAALPQKSPEPKPAPRSQKTPPSGEKQSRRGRPVGATKKSPQAKKGTSGRKRKAPEDNVEDEEPQAKTAKDDTEETGQEEEAGGAGDGGEQGEDIADSKKDAAEDNETKEEKMDVDEGKAKASSQAPISQTKPNISLMMQNPIVKISATDIPQASSKKVAPEVKKPTVPPPEVIKPTPAAEVTAAPAKAETVAKQQPEAPAVQHPEAKPETKETPEAPQTTESPKTTKSPETMESPEISRTEVQPAADATPSVVPVASATPKSSQPQQQSEVSVTVTDTAQNKEAPADGEQVSAPPSTQNSNAEQPAEPATKEEQAITSEPAVTEKPAEELTTEQDVPKSTAPADSIDNMKKDAVQHDGMNNGDSVASAPPPAVAV